MNLPQRRRWERYRKELDVTVSGEDGRSPLSCTTIDICEGGIGVLSAQTLDVGTIYRFDIPDLSATAITGTVRWCTPAPARRAYHIGVELTHATAQQIDELRIAVERWKAAQTGFADA